MAGPWFCLSLLLVLLACGGAQTRVLPPVRFPHIRVLPPPQTTQAQALDQVEIAKTKEVVNKLYWGDIF